jgi:hypothetical protein
VTPRERLLKHLRALNKELKKDGVSPLFANKAAEAFAYTQLQAAVDMTAEELLKVQRVLSEGGGA